MAGASASRSGGTHFALWYAAEADMFPFETYRGLGAALLGDQYALPGLLNMYGDGSIYGDGAGDGKGDGCGNSFSTGTLPGAGSGTHMYRKLQGER